ncbi:MAG: hypothetical protein ACI4J5_04205 [Oscillospiraceae bacterium]
MSMIMFAVMVPLTVISLPKLRRKMNEQLWRRLQRAAYFFYGLIYIHALLSLSMSDSGYLGIVVYSVAFIGYAVFLVIKQYLLRKIRKSPFDLFD